MSHIIALAGMFAAIIVFGTIAAAIHDAIEKRTRR